MTTTEELIRILEGVDEIDVFLHNQEISSEHNMSLDEQFTSVATSVRNWKTTPSNDENLALYSLYKQATTGDVNIAEPSGLVEKAKFKAWTNRKGLSQNDAKKQYIDMAESLKGKYA